MSFATYSTVKILFKGIRIWSEAVIRKLAALMLPACMYENFVSVRFAAIYEGNRLVQAGVGDAMFE